jgi:hypothetical protein
MRNVSFLLAALLVPSVALAGFSVSSYKMESRNTGNSRYNAAAALDGDPATAWMVDPEQANEGQWIELEVPKGKVDKIHVLVGWAESDDTWIDHARLAEARVEVFDASQDRKLVHEQVATFEDKRGKQEIDLPDVNVGDEFSGGIVRLTVTKVYAGKDYSHLALGEMLVFMGEFDAQTIAFSSTPTSEEDSHDGSMLIDGNTRTFWASNGPPAEGEEISFEVDGGRYSVSSIGIVPGPKSYARPKTIEVSQSNVTRTYKMEDTPGKIQYFSLPALVGYTGSGFGPVKVRVVDVYGTGGSGQGVAIAEVKFRATELSAF